MAVKVYDKASQKVVEVDPATAAEGIAAGTFEPAQPKLKVTRAGQTGSVDATQLANARGHGWELSDEAGVASARERIDAHTATSQIQGSIEAALSGASLGLSSVALEALGMDPAKMAARREATGVVGTASEIAGAVAPAFFTGGGSLAAQGGRGLAATVLRNTPAGLAYRGAARAGEGLAMRMGQGATSRIVSAGARNFVEGAAGGAGAQVDENVLGDRELNADLLGAASMGGVFGLGAGYAVPGLAKIASGALRAPVRGMQGILGRMNAATGGIATREVAEMMVDAGTGKLSKGAQLWRSNAIRQGLDEQTADRLARMGDTAEGRADILRLERDMPKIHAEAVELIGERLPSVHRQMDEARRLAGGESKARYWERLGPKTAEAQRAASRSTDDLFLTSKGEVERMIRENVEAAQTYGQGAQIHSVPLLRQAGEMLNKLEMKLVDADQLGGRSSATRKAMALDEYKRSLGSLVDDNGGWGKMRMATPEVRSTNIELRKMYGAAKEHLERTDLWGEAADVQRKLNAAYTASSLADDAFKESAAGSGLSTIINPDGTFNASKALKLVRAHGRVGGDVTVARLTDSLDARLSYFRELAKHADMDDAGRGALSKLEDDVGALKGEFKRQASDAAKLDDLVEARKMEGNKSPSLLTTGTSLAGIMGFGIGGVPGALLGAGLVAARQPHTTLVRYAALRNQLDKVDLRLTGAVAGMFRGAAKAVPKLPAVKLPRVPVAAGAGRLGAKDAEREQKRETALAKAIEMSSSPDAIERALTVSHYDIHDVAPALAGVMQQRVHKAALFLASKAPKVYSRPHSKVKMVDPVAAASFERYLEAVSDPIAALGRFSQGRITSETAEAIRIVYPALYADLQDRIQTELADAAAEGREIPYAARIRLGLLFSTPTDPSLSGPVAMEIQAAIGADFDEPDAATAMAGANKPNPSGAPKAGKIDRETTQLQTGAERASSWRSIA